MNAKHLQFKVLLEGVQIPVNRVEIQASINTPPTALIYITPINEARLVYPRTLTHVLWYHDGAWRCIFEGEVVGRRFVKRENQRSVVFDAMGYESYWNQAYRLFFDPESHKPVDGQSISRTIDNQTIVGDTRVPIGNFLAKAFLKDSNPKNTSGDNIVTLQEGIQNILVSTLKLNNFFRLASARLRLAERIHVVNNTFALRLLKNLIAAPDAKSTNKYGTFTTLWQALLDLLQEIYYNYIPITSPTMSSTGVPVNHLIMPEAAWSSPPRCNVFFPEHYREFSFDHSFLAEPTRTEVIMSHGGEKINEYFAPKEIAQLLTADKGQKRNTGTEDKAFLMPEEILKGVIYNQEFFSSRETIFSSLTTEAQEELAKNYASVVHYLHNRARESSRNIRSLVGRFNPFVVCGLPAMVLDPDWGSFWGLLTGYTHTMDARGESSTVAALSNVRVPTAMERPDFIPAELVKELYEAEGEAPFAFFDPDQSIQGTPVWFDNNLNPVNIGDMVYAEALGMPKGRASIMVGEDGTLYDTVPQAADGLRDYYLNLDEGLRNDWALRYVQRDLATEYDVLSGVGARPVQTDEEKTEFEKTSKADRSTSAFAEYEGGMTIAQMPTATIATLLTAVDGPFLNERQKWARVLRRRLTERHVHYK